MARRITRALEHLDDSSGIIGDQLRATMRTYARACTVASPSPKSLSSWLVRLQYDGPGWPDVIIADLPKPWAPGESRRWTARSLHASPTWIRIPGAAPGRSETYANNSWLARRLQNVSREGIARLNALLAGPWRDTRFVCGFG